MSRKRKTGKNVELELEIESIGFEGVAIARKEGAVYFVKGAVPGDKVRARLLRKKKTYFEAETVEILERSEHRVEPRCHYFGVCGGCSWQNLSYEEQALWKKRHIEDAFKRIGKVDVKEYRETMSAASPFHYRNKMEFSFGASRWLTKEEINSENEIKQKDFALGLHIPGRYDKVLDINNCYIQPPIGADIMNAVRKAALDVGARPYDVRNHQGFLRNLIIRSAPINNEIMVIILTSEPKEEEDGYFLNWFEKDFPELFTEVSVSIHAVNNTLSPVAAGVARVLKGSGFITDTIMGIDYRISPFSFFQTNSGQLDKFISLIIEFAAIKEGSTVWDLYCGAGSISLPAAKYARKVIGVELVESSIADAKANAALNGIDNAFFYCADLHSKEAPGPLSSLPAPDVIIIDPPRAGMHSGLCARLLDIGAERIVYVSCNPATQARDCAALSAKYDLEIVQPVDMFPQTYHVESVALLKKR